MPNSSSMNSGDGASRLMDCIADTPPEAGSRTSARITNVENAKNTPPLRPAPTAPATARAGPRSIDHRGTPLVIGTSHTPLAASVDGEVGEVLRRAAQGTLDAVGDVRVAAVEDLAEQVGQKLDDVLGNAVREGDAACSSIETGT